LPEREEQDRFDAEKLVKRFKWGKLLLCSDVEKDEAV
jgi:hypothetical protein